jgi:hypothetical protein
VTSSLGLVSASRLVLSHVKAEGILPWALEHMHGLFSGRIIPIYIANVNIKMCQCFIATLSVQVFVTLGT